MVVICLHNNLGLVTVLSSKFLPLVPGELLTRNYWDKFTGLVMPCWKFNIGQACNHRKTVMTREYLPILPVKRPHEDPVHNFNMVPKGLSGVLNCGPLCGEAWTFRTADETISRAVVSLGKQRWSPVSVCATINATNSGHIRVCYVYRSMWGLQMSLLCRAAYILPASLRHKGAVRKKLFYTVRINT